MEITSTRGSVSRLANNWRKLPSGEVGYHYERELPQSEYNIQIDFSGYCERGTHGVCIALSLHYNWGIYKGDYYVWRGCFTSRELLPEDTLTVPPIFTLGMSLEEIERAKLEDLQMLIDTVDKIDDVPDVPEQIGRVVEDYGLVEA